MRGRLGRGVIHFANGSTCQQLRFRDRALTGGFYRFGVVGFTRPFRSRQVPTLNPTPSGAFPDAAQIGESRDAAQLHHGARQGGVMAITAAWLWFLARRFARVVIE